jgi:hypothetical protein
MLGELGAVTQQLTAFAVTEPSIIVPLSLMLFNPDPLEQPLLIAPLVMFTTDKAPLGATAGNEPFTVDVVPFPGKARPC